MATKDTIKAITDRVLTLWQSQKSPPVGHEFYGNQWIGGGGGGGRSGSNENERNRQTPAAPKVSKEARTQVYSLQIAMRNRNDAYAELHHAQEMEWKNPTGETVTMVEKAMDDFRDKEVVLSRQTELVQKTPGGPEYLTWLRDTNAWQDKIIGAREAELQRQQMQLRAIDFGEGD